jgi:hypothetical protein
LQYVEQVRPDVLTLHESPVRPQFQKLMEAAHRLGRGFYYAQFSPEDKAASGPRTVQAIAFPLPGKPDPANKLGIEFDGAVRLVGYDWTQEGNVARLALYYRVLEKTRIEYVTEVEIGDMHDETWGYWSRHPVSEYYPTYLWEQGKYYRDVYDVVLTPDAPQGDYVADVTWFRYDAGTAKRDEASAQTVRLTGLRVGD